MSKKRFNEEVVPTVKAWLRQGTKELAQVLPAFPDSVKSVEEWGMPGNPTSQSVSMDMGLYGDRSRDNEPEIELD